MNMIGGLVLLLVSLNFHILQERAIIEVFKWDQDLKN